MLKVDKDLEVRLYGAILPLGLPVCLKIKAGKKPLLDDGEVTEQWPEFRGKKGDFIGHDWVWKAVVPYYHVYDNFCKPSAGMLMVIFTGS